MFTVSLSLLLLLACGVTPVEAGRKNHHLLWEGIPTFGSVPIPVEGFSNDVFPSPHLVRRQSQSTVEDFGFKNPVDGGGAVLTRLPEGGPRGEPLNIIISTKSHPAVMKDTLSGGGLQNYFLSVGFGGECLGQHIGDHQAANLGDGQGYVNETAVMRWNYGDPTFGTCKESIQGGNHLRYWVQKDTGAIFMAVSYEHELKMGHLIIPNGYNVGRDQFIGNATALSSAPPTLTFALPSSSNATNSTSSSSDSSTPLASSSTSSSSAAPTTTSPPPPPPTPLGVSKAITLPMFKGQTKFGNYTYETTSTYLTGLLSNTSDGINHYDYVGDEKVGRNAIDGLVALLEIQIVGTPDGVKLSAASPSPTFSSISSTIFLSLSISFILMLI